MSRIIRIAIDGPVASGKSTIGRHLAQRLGYLFLDTGVMYRGVTRLVLDHGIEPGDDARVTALARSVRFSFPQIDTPSADNPPLLADGIDITSGLRDPEVDRTVSLIASYAGVREALVRHQQALAREQSLVMVGRDIGTVVLPDADVKIFLTASVEDRAGRRYAERVAVGIPMTLEDTLADLKRRDRLDSERSLSPLRPAYDAILVDTSGLESAQSLELVSTIVREHLSGE